MDDIKLVFAPSVQVVAHTVIDLTGLHQWADAHGMTELAYDGMTPLGTILSDVDGNAVRSIDALPEFGGRFCYRSWDRGRSRPGYLKNIVESAHGSVLHHSTLSFAISGVSRSLSLELLRHHAGADPSQESQRFVDAKDVRFVVPPLIDAMAAQVPSLLTNFERQCRSALDEYQSVQHTLEGLLGRSSDLGGKLGTMAKKRVLEAARAHLPNCAETRLLWTMNLRAARHVCALRGSEGADLEIRRLAVVFTQLLQEYAPHTFYDFEIYTAPDGFEAVRCQHPKV